MLSEGLQTVIAVCLLGGFRVLRAGEPIAMRHGTGLPTVALFFGLAGGIEAYGPLGLFAGPAVIAIFGALLQVYRRTYAGTGLRR